MECDAFCFSQMLPVFFQHDTVQRDAVINRSHKHVYETQTSRITKEVHEMLYRITNYLHDVHFRVRRRLDISNRATV
jgi:hypothetical protein